MKKEGVSGPEVHDARPASPLRQLLTSKVKAQHNTNMARARLEGGKDL